MACFSNKIKNNCAMFVLGVSVLVGLLGIIICIYGSLQLFGKSYELEGTD